MKETKVCVDDETLMKCERYRHNSCPIIQTHDRELVKEVCEKIRKRARIECGSIYSLLSELADEIQKEFEK